MRCLNVVPIKGLTQEQVNAILTHMAFSQYVYMTEDGVLEE